jgi:hypothetical protein
MSPRLLLLIDGLGALLSAALLNALPEIGIPVRTLQGLALAATVMASYSLTCSWTGRTGRPYLRSIALANATYCTVTLALLIWHRSTLTMLGLLYFGAEILIISLLIRLEWKS